MPILSQGRFPKIVYVDGFAGPGTYRGGEQGSPLIAIETALGFRPPLAADLLFIFVEKDKERAANLLSLINTKKLPPNFSVEVEGGTTFEEAFNRHYEKLTSRGGRLPPTFAFVDPFGWKGVPFSIINKIMQHPSCEVFINFMYEEINRFLAHPDQQANFDAYFGTDAWRQFVAMKDPAEHNRGLRGLYAQQLRATASIRYVRSFEMRNERDVTDYFLFYGTNSLLGLKKMKEAMWKVDEAGEFRFSDATDVNQLVLFEKLPDFNRLRAQIIDRFGSSPVTIAEIDEFVLVETAFRETHYKKQVLAKLEQEERLRIVSAKPTRRRGTFADPDIVVQFLS